MLLDNSTKFSNESSRFHCRDGHVQTFSVPKAPASPEEADIASELKAYETQQVELEGAVTEDGAAPVEEDWFVEEEEGEAAAH